MTLPSGPVLVTLVDGEIVTSDAEAWRHETEARAILSLPDINRRRSWLADIAAKRGDVAADRLRKTMQLLHEKRVGG